jgi:SAM-dependent methyltransferase
VSTEPGQPDARLNKAYRERQLEVIAARWDARAADWDRALEDPCCHLNEDDAYRRFLRQARRIIDGRREFCAQQGLIDAGCGTGLVLANLIPAFAWGVGVDISPEMIRLAAARRIPHARFLVSDCFRLDRINAKAGAVVSRGVLLSHYGQTQGQELLRTAREALVPAGFVLFDFLNEESRSKQVHVPEDKTYFTREQVLAMAQQAGFNRIRICGSKERRVLLVLAERQNH